MTTRKPSLRWTRRWYDEVELRIEFLNPSSFSTLDLLAKFECIRTTFLNPRQYFRFFRTPRRKSMIAMLRRKDEEKQHALARLSDQLAESNRNLAAAQVAILMQEYCEVEGGHMRPALGCQTSLSHCINVQRAGDEGKITFD